jgi:hypothetical protein
MMGTIIFKLLGAVVIAAYTEFALGVNNREENFGSLIVSFAE